MRSTRSALYMLIEWGLWRCLEVVVRVLVLVVGGLQVGGYVSAVYRAVGEALFIFFL